MTQAKEFETKRTTLDLPKQLLEAAQEETGEGITKTITAGLEKIVHARGYKRLLALEGKINLELNIDELRKDRVFE